MGLLTVSICGVTTGLFCDRLNAIVDIFHPSDLSQYLVQIPEILTIISLTLLAFIFYFQAYLREFPYNDLNSLKNVTTFPEIDYSLLNSHGQQYDNDHYERKTRQVILEGFNFNSPTSKYSYDASMALFDLLSFDEDGCFAKRICKKLLNPHKLPEEQKKLLLSLRKFIKENGYKSKHSYTFGFLTDISFKNITMNDCNKQFINCYD